LITEPNYTVDARRLDELSAVELYALLKMRVDVFVVEQNCPYPELDGKDADALHLRLLQDGDLIAAARIFAPADKDAPPRSAASSSRLIIAANASAKR